MAGFKPTGSATEKAIFGFAQGFQGKDKAESSGEKDSKVELPSSTGPTIDTKTDRQKTETGQVDTVGKRHARGEII